MTVDVRNVWGEQCQSQGLWRDDQRCRTHAHSCLGRLRVCWSAEGRRSRNRLAAEGSTGGEGVVAGNYLFIRFANNNFLILFQSFAGACEERRDDELLKRVGRFVSVVNSTVMITHGLVATVIYKDLRVLGLSLAPSYCAQSTS